MKTFCIILIIIAVICFTASGIIIKVYLKDYSSNYITEVSKQSELEIREEIKKIDINGIDLEEIVIKQTEDAKLKADLSGNYGNYIKTKIDLKLENNKENIDIKVIKDTDNRLNIGTYSSLVLNIYIPTMFVGEIENNADSNMLEVKYTKFENVFNINSYNKEIKIEMPKDSEYQVITKGKENNYKYLLDNTEIARKQVESKNKIIISEKNNNIVINEYTK